MFNPTTIVIDAFVETLKESYERVYGLLDPEYGNVARFVGRISLENIANSDAAYHDVNHTIMVTQVGIEILRGKQISQGGYQQRTGLTLLSHFSATTSDIYVEFAEATRRETTFVTSAVIQSPLTKGLPMLP